MYRKYNNRKTVIDGITFDSKKEATRYALLKNLEKAGEIKNLRLQVPFTLIPDFVVDGKKIRGIKYYADFVYDICDSRNGLRTVVEDVKGVRTDVYKIKKKLMAYKYGITIEEM